MKDLINIRNIASVQKLDNEYDLQKAVLLDRKLRQMIKDDDSLKPIREKLRGLIQDYEEENWSDDKLITNDQIVETEKAEFLIENERKFIQERKEAIRKRLKNYDINQQELGEILGHPKSYMSELINGVSQFTLKDLVIIHRILKIDLLLLIPTFLQNETKEKVKQSIMRLNKPKLRLRKEDLLV